MKNLNRKAGRPRSQKGSLQIRSGSWLGRYRRHIGGATEQVAFRIGHCSEVTEAQAREALKCAIDRDTARMPLIHRVGVNGLVAANSEHQSALPGTRGAIAELLVCADLMSKDIEVFRALDPQSSCDLVAIDKERRFLRIEVKGISPNSAGAFQCNVSRNLGKFDLIAFVSRNGTIEYRRPEEIAGQTFKRGKVVRL